MRSSRRDPPVLTALGPALSGFDASRAVVERNRLMAALAVSPDGAVIVDAEGDEVFRNAAAERFRNARHADAVAESAIAALLEQARRDGAACERELRLFGPPRAVFRLRALPLWHDDELLGAAAFVQDVSESRRVESVRRDFVANVSHELKTPIGALELLAETLASESDPAVTRPLAERMAREAERLGRLVDDLLDLSLIETQESPTRDVVAVEMLLGEAVERVRPTALTGGIEVRLHDAAPGAVLACDRLQVLSAVTNLLDNAVKYSEPGGAVDVDVMITDGRLVISVSDQGIGIPARDLERIFERFYRVDQARSRATGGTGLGLAIVRHVAQAHGGEVTVESIEGQGSKFRFVLPIDVDSEARES
jgi:two-component system sensor histidine kinase SenX3